MQLYADYAPRRARQLTGDIVALFFMVGWIALGVWLYQLIAAFQQFGRQMQEAGAGFRSTMIELGDTLGSVPLIGSGIRVPFDGASEAGGALENAGQSQQDTVLTAATAFGVIIAVVPIGVMLFLWLLPRIRFARRATEAKTLAGSPGGTELLALRALSTHTLADLAAVAPDAVGLWRAGDPVTVARLAQLQLRSLGVRAHS